MRRRTLLILALSLLLVIPAVVAAAASGSDAVGSSAVTADRLQEQARDCGACLYDSVNPDRDQVRDQDQDRTNAPVVVGDQIQEQKQLRLHEPPTGEVGEQTQARDRAQVRDRTSCDDAGLQLREHVRTEAQLELNLAEFRGEQQGYGPGVGGGAGPLGESPADGAGNQFGVSGR